MENGECPFLSSIRHLQPACGGCGQDDQAQMSPVTPASLHCWECWLSRGKGYPMSCRKFIWQKQRRERVQSNLSGWITRILIFFLNTIPPGLLSPLKYHLLHGTLQWQLCCLLSAALKPVCFMASPACYPWGLSRMSHSCWSVLRRSTEQPQQISA